MFDGILILFLEVTTSLEIPHGELAFNRRPDVDGMLTSAMRRADTI